MALGHEIAGTVEKVGAEVSRVSPGMRVAVNPSRPCDQCRYCRAGQHNQCLDMRFIGSAMRFPHVQGGFRQSLTVDEAQAIPIAPAMTMAEAAMAEPLAVCLHAARQAGSLLGARVLVTGCGPIGALAVVAARFAGAAEIVATDVSDFPLSLAETSWGDAHDQHRRGPAGAGALRAGQGNASTCCSRLPATRRHSAAPSTSVRPGGIVVQLGLGGDMKLPMNADRGEGDPVARDVPLR